MVGSLVQTLLGNWHCIPIQIQLFHQLLLLRRQLRQPGRILKRLIYLLVQINQALAGLDQVVVGLDGSLFQILDQMFEGSGCPVGGLMDSDRVPGGTLKAELGFPIAHGFR